MNMDLMLCVNDPDNGQHTNQVVEVELCDVIHLETPFVDDDWEPDGLPCSVEPGHVLNLDGLKFNLKGYQTWVGNICWDCATLEGVHVARIINHLKEKGWTLQEAETELWGKYHSEAEITEQDLEALLEVD